MDRDDRCLGLGWRTCVEICAVTSLYYLDTRTWSVLTLGRAANYSFCTPPSSSAHEYTIDNSTLISTKHVHAQSRLAKQGCSLLHLGRCTAICGQLNEKLHRRREVLDCLKRRAAALNGGPLSDPLIVHFDDNERSVAPLT